MTIQNNVLNDNVISYDSGGKVFEHDKDRGKWSSNWDFLAAIIGHSFSMVNFALIPAQLINIGGVFFIIFYFLGAIIFIIPILYIQSFLGQFSSTGFISAFRIAPMFKGIGYLVLCSNLVAVCYHTVFSALPLVYLFTSMVPELPWMSCTNSWNTEHCVVSTYNSANYTYYAVRSTDEFFRTEMVKRSKSEWTVSWQILVSTFLIWILLAVIMSTKTKNIGKTLRYITLIIITLLIIFFIRILCLPNSLILMLEFLTPSLEFPNVILNLSSLLLPVILLGSGWGTILTLASYNDFKLKIGKMSFLICISHLIGIILCSSIYYMVDNYVDKFYGFPRFDKYNHVESIFTMFPFLLGNLEVPHFWSVIFFLILFLGEFASCIIQILSIKTALFDEFVILRKYKTRIIFGMLAVLAIFSIVYNFRNGMYLVILLMTLAGVSQMFVCFIELMIVLWVYGRVRFQRDIKFMTGHIFPTWTFFVIRFITPLCVLGTLILYLFYSLYNIIFLPQGNILWLCLTIVIQILPIIIIPIYIIIRLSATTGTLLNRFRRLCKPNDWYPVDPIHRQKYEEYLDNSDITHQLVDVNELYIEDSQLYL